MHNMRIFERCPLWVNCIDLAASVVGPVIGPFQTWRLAIEGVAPEVIQAPKLEPQTTQVLRPFG